MVKLTHFYPAVLWWIDGVIATRWGDDIVVVSKVIDDEENDEWNVMKKGPVLYYSKRQSSSPSTMRFSIKPCTVQVQKSRTSQLRVHDASHKTTNLTWPFPQKDEAYFLSMVTHSNSSTFTALRRWAQIRSYFCGLLAKKLKKSCAN